MALDTSVPRTRRAVLAAAVGGLGALVGSAFGRPAITNAATGDNLKLGQSNDSGTSQTILLNAGLGAAFTLKTTNSATGATGIFGWSSQAGANATRGVYGLANGANSFGVEGKSNALAPGGGAAVHGLGGLNDGVYGLSDSASGVHGDCTDGPGVAGGSTNSHGVHAESDNSDGVHGRANAGSGVVSGVYGYALSTSTGAAGVAGHHAAAGSSTVYGVIGSTAATSANSAGVSGLGTGANGNGVLATNLAGAGSYGLYAQGYDTGVYGQGGTWGVYAVGDCYVTGDFSAGGSKAGYVVDVAVNGSRQTLKQGDLVTLLGVRPAVLGSIPLLEVGPASVGDAVIGVVDRRVDVRRAPAKAGGDHNQVKASGTVAKPEEHLYVVTLGAFAAASVDASAGAIRAGDRLSAGPNGRLTRATPVSLNGRSLYPTGEQVGYALGSLASGTGTIGIFVSPH